MQVRKKQQKNEYNILRVTEQSDFNLTGKIEPVQMQTLTLPSGNLQNLNVKNGDHVAQGEALLTMHNDSTQDSVTELQGDLSKSQRTMNVQQQTINNLRQQLNGMGQGDEGYNDLRNQLTEAQMHMQTHKQVLLPLNNSLAPLQARLIKH